MTDVTYQKELDSTQADSRRDSLHAELEATRSAYHRMLQTVSKSRWQQKSPSSAWTVGEILVHLTWALEYLPEEVEKARRDRGMFNLPKRLSDFISYWYIRWIARSANPASIGRRYDRAMDASIRLLDTLSDEDWEHGAYFYGEGFYSVEDLFHVPAQHMAEHTSGL